MKIQTNFGENFGEVSQIPKIREKFPRKFSGKFPENRCGFYENRQRYSAEIILFTSRKDMEVKESFGKVSGKSSEMSKIPGRNFPGKFPGNSGCFFSSKCKDTDQKSIFFYVCKR